MNILKGVLTNDPFVYEPKFKPERTVRPNCAHMFFANNPTPWATDTDEQAKSLHRRIRVVPLLESHAPYDGDPEAYPRLMDGLDWATTRAIDTKLRWGGAVPAPSPGSSEVTRLWATGFTRARPASGEGEVEWDTPY